MKRSDVANDLTSSTKKPAVPTAMLIRLAQTYNNANPDEDNIKYTFRGDVTLTSLRKDLVAKMDEVHKVPAKEKNVTPLCLVHSLHENLPCCRHRRGLNRIFLKLHYGFDKEPGGHPRSNCVCPPPSIPPEPNHSPLSRPHRMAMSLRFALSTAAPSHALLEVSTPLSDM